MTKYNVKDEFDRLIDENVKLKRARKTVKLNPGATIRPAEMNDKNCYGMGTNYQRTIKQLII